jgi:hypothetical protein
VGSCPLRDPLNRPTWNRSGAARGSLCEAASFVQEACNIALCRVSAELVGEPAGCCQVLVKLLFFDGLPFRARVPSVKMLRRGWMQQWSAGGSLYVPPCCVQNVPLPCHCAASFDKLRLEGVPLLPGDE